MDTYLIVGSGYRAQYYGRIASRYPDLFRAVYLCRSDEKAALMRRATGAEAVTSAKEALAYKPDFAVIAVDKAHIATTVSEWTEKGLPVLAETPLGSTREELDYLRALKDKGARISCAEQYRRYPILAEGIAALDEGTIGEPNSVYVSFLHDYHAASLIRRVLRIGPGEGYAIRAWRQQSAVVETDSRAEAILDGRTKNASRDTAVIRFDSGKQAIYDFSSAQYRSYIRTRHLCVRGERGEWSDTRLLYLDGENCPKRRELLPALPPRYRCLDTQALRDRRRHWSAELDLDTVQDEFAVATMLLEMGEYAKGGKPPYEIEEALADAYFSILLGEAVESGKELRSKGFEWN